jgi:hypothetical protein
MAAGIPCTFSFPFAIDGSCGSLKLAASFTAIRKSTGNLSI